MNPAEASARAVDELTDVALPHLPMTDVDRVESDLLALASMDDDECRCCIQCHGADS